MRKNIFVLFFFCIILFFTVTIIGIQTQTKSNAAQVTGNLSLHFEAIDKNNNNVPKHSQRKISLYFYKTNDFSIQPQAKITDYVSYANGTFSNPSLDLSSVAPDTYYILVKSPEGSLAEIVNNAQPVAIASNQTILLNTPVTSLPMGDFDNTNSIDVTDYNILVDCFGDKATSSTCTDHNISDETKGLFPDINDDGIVDLIDYNILIRHFGEKGYGPNFSPPLSPTSFPSLSPSFSLSPSPLFSPSPSVIFITPSPSPAISFGFTPTPTPLPPTPTISVNPTGHFTTLPPGSILPGDSECAARVRRNPSFEPRPANNTANKTNVYANGKRLTGSYLAQYGYETRVTGNFSGTTDEILQWAACKWGFEEDNVRAQAVEESYWKQSQLGNCEGGSVPETNGCQSVGILQVRGADIPPTHPGTWPYAYDSTAFNADYTLAIRRACFEGKETFLHDRNSSYTAGDEWGCIGRWFSGNWYDSIATQDYINKVKNDSLTKPWLKSGF